MRHFVWREPSLRQGSTRKSFLVLFSKKEHFFLPYVAP
jgi:hypothetical protein